LVKLLLAALAGHVFLRKGEDVGISGALVHMGFTEFGLLTSSGVIGSLLVYGYQNWLKKK
jgi:hypothetical protein